MFARSATFYDLIYSWKNYRQEADHLLAIIHTRLPGAKTILDVACGTGEHLRYLREFDRTGLDLDPELLRVARAKLPDVCLVQSDMVAFELDRHVRPGGILCVEPWFTPERWLPRRISMTTAEDGELKV
jgi:ubiquinone/menaquinone biosynthesis C-methylase UbiE